MTIRETGVFEGSGYVPYDDEGTKATDTYLIKNGVLSGRLHSAATAAALGEELTGNARAINCDYEPIVRMTSTFIENGESTLQDLLKDIKHGYYIHSIKHGFGYVHVYDSSFYRIRNSRRQNRRPRKNSGFNPATYSKRLGL